MKYNTYDIPAIKFYVVFGERTLETVRDNELIILYDSFDGLTIKALKSSIKDIIELGEKNYSIINNCLNDCNTIFIISPLETTDKRYNKSFMTFPKEYNLTIRLELNDDNEDKRIDEYIEEIILKNYDEKNPISKVMRCFLQRYRYNTMEEVDEVLKTRTPKKLIRTKE